jgi:two-component system OmpR family response regulator
MQAATPPLVFVVEDDADIAALITGTLKSHGMRSQWFRDGAALLRHLPAEQPDACVLDLGLPDMDGMSLLGHIAAYAACGVLIVTGRDHTADRVMGLEQGADDYVVKPFEPRELVARVRSVLRRRLAGLAAAAGHDARRQASFDGWRFTPASHRLTDPRGESTTLSTAESTVLQCLLERPHQILTRDQLMGQGELSPLDRSIDVRISRLRRKLQEDPDKPPLIKTVYGAGYMFCGVVSWS